MSIKNSFYNMDSTGHYLAPKILEHDSVQLEFKTLSELISKFNLKNEKKNEITEVRNLSLITLYDVYCEELKAVIQINDFKELIEKILKLEDELNLINSVLVNSKKEDIPNINNIYQLITPLVLRTLLSFNFGHISDMKQIEKRWMESLRVAIEEEFFKYKEKILDLQSHKPLKQ
ncbi:MAG: hypothetical protein U0T83_00505 [Bacteriovoracaceae bacterium]